MNNILKILLTPSFWTEVYEILTVFLLKRISEHAVTNVCSFASHRESSETMSNDTLRNCITTFSDDLSVKASRDKTIPSTPDLWKPPLVQTTAIHPQWPQTKDGRRTDTSGTQSPAWREPEKWTIRIWILITQKWLVEIRVIISLLLCFMRASTNAGLLQLSWQY